MSHSWTSSSSQCQVTSSRNAFHWRLWRHHKILTLLTRGCCCCLRRDSPETKAKAGGGVMAAPAAAAAASTCTYTRLALLPWRCYRTVSGWEFNGSLKGCLQEHKCHSQTTLLPPKWSLVAAKYYDGRTTAAAARQDGMYVVVSEVWGRYIESQCTTALTILGCPILLTNHQIGTFWRFNSSCMFETKEYGCPERK